MRHISSFHLKGVSGEIKRVEINGRRVDYWSPKNPRHLLIAHDGNNVFDKEASTLGVTWNMAEVASKVFLRAGITPPAIVGVYHKGNGPESHGRIQELSPQRPFQNGINPEVKVDFDLRELRADRYHEVWVA